MDTIKRIVSRKISNTHYTHALYFVGTSKPIAFLYKNFNGWILHDLDGRKLGIYENLLRTKMRAFEFGLIHGISI